MDATMSLLLAFAAGYGLCLLITTVFPNDNDDNDSADTPDAADAN